MKTELRRQLLLQAELDKSLNNLIRDMRQLVDETGIAASKMEKNQMSNLLATAMETASPELMQVYIQYQIGRDNKGENWRYRNFGETLLTRLNRLRQNQAASIARTVRRAMEQDEKAVTDEEIDETWLQLMRHYLGQLNRYFYYRKEVNP